MKAPGGASEAIKTPDNADCSTGTVRAAEEVSHHQGTGTFKAPIEATHQVYTETVRAVEEVIHHQGTGTFKASNEATHEAGEGVIHHQGTGTIKASNDAAHQVCVETVKAVAEATDHQGSGTFKASNEATNQVCVETVRAVAEATDHQGSGTFKASNEALHQVCVETVRAAAEATDHQGSGTFKASNDATHLPGDIAARTTRAPAAVQALHEAGAGCADRSDPSYQPAEPASAEPCSIQAVDDAVDSCFGSGTFPLGVRGQTPPLIPPEENSAGIAGSADADALIDASFGSAAADFFGLDDEDMAAFGNTQVTEADFDFDGEEEQPETREPTLEDDAKTEQTGTVTRKRKQRPQQTKPAAKRVPNEQRRLAQEERERVKAEKKAQRENAKAAKTMQKEQQKLLQATHQSIRGSGLTLCDVFAAPADGTAAPACAWSPLDETTSQSSFSFTATQTQLFATQATQASCFGGSAAVAATQATVVAASQRNRLDMSLEMMSQDAASPLTTLVSPIEGEGSEGCSPVLPKGSGFFALTHASAQLSVKRPRAEDGAESSDDEDCELELVQDENTAASAAPPGEESENELDHLEQQRIARRVELTRFKKSGQATAIKFDLEPSCNSQDVLDLIERSNSNSGFASFGRTSKRAFMRGTARVSDKMDTSLQELKKKSVLDTSSSVFYEETNAMSSFPAAPKLKETKEGPSKKLQSILGDSQPKRRKAK
ncbi:hypothetical protein DIPPA_21341 [Diplonema papillatum]|nr:hypothetical protein DIPPA_21341 [Diplonema papillatum]